MSTSTHEHATGARTQSVAADPSATRAAAPSGDSDLEIRAVRPGDGPLLHRLAADVGGLDVNTRYFYELMASMFTDTCRLARDDAGPLGFVVGVRPPDRPDSLFVWQVGVLGRARGRGVAKALLDHFVDAAEPTPNALEATVTPGNRASRRLFASFADSRDSEISWEPYLSADSLSDGASQHEREDLLSIPLPR